MPELYQGLPPVYALTALAVAIIAASHAAAIAALVKSYNPRLNAAQIRNILTSTALDIEAGGYERDSGYGIVMADRALQKAQQMR